MERRDTRRLILDAGAAEFATHGVRGTRIQAVVKRSGVNERMIYHHFGSKDGLYQAVLTDQWKSVETAWRACLADAKHLAPREGLTRAFDGLIDVCAARPRFFQLVMHEAMNGWEHAPAASLDQIPAELTRLHAAGVRAGVFRRDVRFRTLYLTLLGALVPQLLGARFGELRGRAPLVKASREAVRLILDGASV